MQIPSDRGKCADMLYEIQQRRFAVNRQAEALRKQEQSLSEHLMSLLTEDDRMAGGTVGKITLVFEEVPVVEDASLFRQYIESSGEYDLCQSMKPASQAVKARWDEAEEVPGVGRLVKRKLSIRKA